MSNYRKLIVALGGIAALIALRYFKVEIQGVEPIIVDLVLGSLTAAGVYGLPNEEDA